MEKIGIIPFLEEKILVVITAVIDMIESSIREWRGIGVHLQYFIPKRPDRSDYGSTRPSPTHGPPHERGKVSEDLSG